MPSSMGHAANPFGGFGGFGGGGGSGAPPANPFETATAVPFGGHGGAGFDPMQGASQRLVTGPVGPALKSCIDLVPLCCTEMNQLKFWSRT